MFNVETRLDVYDQIIEEDGIDSLATLWDRLNHYYRAQGINDAVAGLKEITAEESHLFGDKDALPEDESAVAHSDLPRGQVIETLNTIRAVKKAKARASGLRVVKS